MHNISNLRYFLEDKDIIIYGTGYIAKKFFDLLILNGIGANVKFFVVTKKKEQEVSIKGIGVRTIEECVIKKSDIVCLAVHETLKNEIETVLLKYKIENYIWIYPYLVQLLPLKPLQMNVLVPIRDILQANEDYRFAIRYLAIENYYNKNTYGFDIYIKAMGLHCEHETAKKRADKFCSLIRNWEQFGYNCETACWINEDKQIFDGAHRISLAKYHGQSDINCDIYKTLPSFWKWYEGDVMLTKKEIDNTDFSMEQLKIIEDAYKRVREET